MNNKLISEINKNRKLMNIVLLNEASIPIPALFMRNSKLTKLYNNFLKTNADVKKWLDNPNTKQNYGDPLNNIHAYIDINSPLDKFAKFSLVSDYLDITPIQLKNMLGGLINHTKSETGPKFNETFFGSQYDTEIQNYLANNFSNLKSHQRDVVAHYFKTWVKVGGSFNQKFNVGNISKLASKVDFNNRSILKILSLYKTILITDMRKTRATLDAEILDIYYSYIDNSIKTLTSLPESIDANTAVYANEINKKLITYYTKFGEYSFNTLSNLIKTYKESKINRPSYGDSPNVDLGKIESFEKIINDLSLRGDKYTGTRFIYYLTKNYNLGEVIKELVWSPFNKPEIQVKMKLKFAEKTLNFFKKVSSNTVGKYILWGPAANFNLYILALRQLKNLLQNESIETISKTEKGKMLIGLISSWLLFCFINFVRRFIYLAVSIPVGVSAAAIIGLQKIIGITFPYSEESIRNRDYNNDSIVSVTEAVRYEMVVYFKKAVIKFSTEAGYTFNDAFWNFILPPEITNPEQGIILTGAREGIEFLVNLEPGENVSYASFREAILGQMLSKVWQGIKSGSQAIISGAGQAIISGAGQITISNPTWSYGPTIGKTRQLIINFDKSKIKSLVINGRPLNVTNLKLNSNNKPATNIPIDYEITNIKLTDNNNKNYNLTQK